MKLKIVDILPHRFPEKTLLLLKCTMYKYAKSFVEQGEIYFAMPESWCQPDGTSRGDCYEGVYASQLGFNSELDRLFKH